ncbi:hypothetical protein MTR67_028104 [Solanum verrucosum]|uniref:Protein TIFY n=1 Tax=Solanum verrucosum TaxID=315347 RepID=A0AAF0TWC0_SOLVR|nr:hypothetical protein MTR67_028104 [Solanum verrucosum]
MAHIQSNKSVSGTATAADEVKPAVTTFHDFLGKGYPQDSSPGMSGRVVLPSEASPSASVSLGASSGGGRGPISTTSDLGSVFDNFLIIVERVVGNHFEGVPFYGLRGELSGPETSNRLLGTKRSNSDSLMGSTRDKFAMLRSDALESSHMQKLLRNAGGERRGRPQDQEMSFVMHPMRPLHASLISQPSATGRTDVNASKWDRVIPVNVGPTLQYPPRASHGLPFGYQSSSNRFGDANAGPSNISQAADEGSRTGIKGSGILSSINASGGISDRSLSGVPLSGAKQKSTLHFSDLESSNPCRQGSSPAGSQMTIFYGGQAHVFDNVHPNKVCLLLYQITLLFCVSTVSSTIPGLKEVLGGSPLNKGTEVLSVGFWKGADVIMSLAGSNGGSWSTTYAPKPAARPSTGENYSPKAENETTKGNNLALIRELHGRSSGKAGFTHGFGSGDHISIPQGVLRGVSTTKEAKTAVQVAENVTDEKGDM